jgi:formylglycine-generating enzyme required for sulfatase activity
MKSMMMSCAVFLGSLAAFSATVENVGLATNAQGVVTVTYALDAPAIVTADVLTNGVSIGGARQWSLSGDVHRPVAAGENRSFTWKACEEAKDIRLENVTVEVKAWAESDAPDYLVADLLKVSDCRLRYYASAVFLPGGIVSNEWYRMYRMPFRKIRAKGVSWTMGTTTELGRVTSGNETAHSVQLAYNYYIAVFELTKAQGEAVGVTKSSDCTHSKTSRWRLTPFGRSTWNSWRGESSGATPTASSILGKISSRIGLTADFPLESEWEFAARGGYGEGTWGDGSAILTKQGNDRNLTRIAIYAKNKGAMTEVGTCAPNGYGLYDMHGNIAEYCRDWYQSDITSLNGAWCVDPTDYTRRADGVVGTNRVLRGGYWSYNADQVRASFRQSGKPGDYKTERGGRPMTYAHLGDEVAPAVAVSTNRFENLDFRPVPEASISALPVSRRTYHALLSAGFELDTLTPPGLMLILR